MSDTLAPEALLFVEEGLTSQNGRYSLWYQTDGNLVLYTGDGVAIWASGTQNVPGVLAMQGDGNLVLKDSQDAPYWASGTNVPGSSLVVQNDGNVVIYTPDGVPVWASGTAGLEPLEPTPEPEPGGPDDATIFLVSSGGKPVPGVLVTKEDGDSRLTDGSGFCHIPSRGENTFKLEKEGFVYQEVRVGQGIFPLSLERVRPAHPDPVEGQIQVVDGSFADASGKRTFAIMHAGDFIPRWMAAKATGNQAAIEKILSDLDDIAEAGYHIIRTWWHLRPSPPDTPWAHGGDPSYNGCDSLGIPNFVEWGVEFVNEVYDRGMRVAIGSGGLDKVNQEQERRMMGRFREVINGVGQEKFAWAEPVNEPSSTHGTSDDNGDVEPTYLKSLAKIMVDGTRIIWHLGHASNVEWDTGRFGQKFYTPGDQPVGYHHPYRDGRVWDKIRHWFSWAYEAPGQWKRLWILGEGVGRPNSGPPLRYVSATANGHELTAEALALLGAMGTMRGMAGSMSGTGVQRYEPFTNIVGFREIPWLISKLPKDINSFSTFHHSGESKARERVLAAVGECRIDGSINGDGRFAYVIYGPSGGWNLPVTKSFTGILYNPDGTSQEVSKRAGETFSISFATGRLLVGRLT